MKCDNCVFELIKHLFSLQTRGENISSQFPLDDVRNHIHQEKHQYL